MPVFVSKVQTQRESRWQPHVHWEAVPSADGQAVYGQEKTFPQWLCWSLGLTYFNPTAIYFYLLPGWYDSLHGSLNCFILQSLPDHPDHPGQPHDCGNAVYTVAVWLLCPGVPLGKVIWFWLQCFLTSVFSVWMRVTLCQLPHSGLPTCQTSL